MHKTQRKHKLFYTYFFSYILILFIPLLIILALIRWRFIDTLEQQLNKNNMEQLSRISFVVDTELGKLNDILSQIYLTDDLKPYSKDELFDNRSIIDELNKFVSTNSFIEDIFIYYRGSDYIYSSTSSYNVSFFYNTMYHYENWDYKSFMQNINNLSQPTLRLPESVKAYDEESAEYLTYMYPLNFNNLSPFGTLLFLIPKESIDVISKDVMSNRHILILDDLQRIVSAPSDFDFHNSQAFMNKIRHAEKSFLEEVEVNGSTYLVTSIRSASTQWQYVAISPLKEALAPITDIYLILIYGVIIIMITCGALIYFLMRKNYAPLKALKTMSDSLFQSETDNELDSVRKTMEFLSLKNTELSEEVLHSQVACKDYFVTQLIKGEIKNTGDFNVYAKKYGLPLTKHYFTCAFISIHHDGKLRRELVKQIVMDIHKQTDDSYHFYCREGIERNKLILIIGSDSSKEKELDQRLLKLQQSFYEQMKIRMTIGVGSSYHKCSSLPLSYMDAVTALNYQFIHGKKSIIFYSKVVKHFSYQDYHPGEDLKLLQQAIKNGSLEDIDTLTKGLVKHIRDHKLPLFMVRNSCFEIIHFLVTISKKHHIQLEHYPDVFDLSTYDTIDDLMKIIKELSHKVSQHLATVQSKNPATSLESMELYIKKHFKSYDFTLNKMAEHFQLHPSNLSAMYKELTNETIYDYVTRLRMEESIQLLLNTEGSVKSIATEVGYDNSSSFIRRFKQVYQLTPGKYRKLHKS